MYIQTNETLRPPSRSLDTLCACRNDAAETLGLPVRLSDILCTQTREKEHTIFPPKDSPVNKTRAELRIDLLNLSYLNDEERREVENLIKKKSYLFHITGDKLGYTNATTHKIKTINDEPVHSKQYRHPRIHREEINRQIQELLTNDIIQESGSPYNSPLWIEPKKAEAQGRKRWRLVLDFRELNAKTIGDAYPLPNISDILDQLRSAKYFTTLDLASGFHQIRMDPDDVRKTVFSTPYGHYEFTRMPFGLSNASATFQGLMNATLSDLQGIEILDNVVYLDDIVVYASSLQEHEIKFNKLADRMRRANLKLQLAKCKFLNK